MIKVLLVPSSDYLGHPFPQRHNQLFELLGQMNQFEVHVARFCLSEKPTLLTNLLIHELGGKKHGALASYYLLNAFRHALQIRRIVKKEGIDVIVLSNLAAPLAVSFLDHLSSMDVPIVFDLPDYFPTSASGYVFDANSISHRSATGVFAFVLPQLLRRSRLVTVASSLLKEYALSVGAKRVVNVPNGISQDFLERSNGKEIRKALGYEDHDIVVGYIGSVEFWLDLRSLIKGVAITRKKGLPTKLLIVGRKLQSKYSEKLEEWLREENMADFTTWLDFIPHYEVPKYMAAIDIGTIPFDAQDPTAYYSAPNKLWEYFSQNKSVISTPIPEVSQYSNMVHLASTPEEYAQKTLMISENKAEVQRRVSMGSNEAMKKTWKNSANIFASELRSLVR
jgi:glycosyltransferase involved in cell wall biosynthesis